MSFALDVEKLKKIDNKTQCTVFGFIHNAQRLFKEAEDNPYFIIPDLICYTVLAFYFSSFRFNICTTDQDIAIKNDGKQIYAERGQCVGRYFSCGDSNGRESGECTVKINNKGFYGIGIISDKSNLLTDNWIWQYESGEFYYVCSTGSAWKKGHDSGQFHYDNWTAGDIIKIIWNDHGAFLCHINGEYVGAMGFTKGLTYYFCVSADTGQQIGLEIIE